MNKDVRKFKISMNDSMFIQVDKPVNQLSYNLSNKFLRQSLSFFLVDKILQVASIIELWKDEGFVKMCFWMETSYDIHMIK